MTLMYILQTNIDYGIYKIEILYIFYIKDFLYLSDDFQMQKSISEVLFLFLFFHMQNILKQRTFFFILFL